MSVTDSDQPEYLGLVVICVVELMNLGSRAYLVKVSPLPKRIVIFMAGSSQGEEMRNLINKILKRFNIGITRFSVLEGLKSYEKDVEKILCLPRLEQLKLLEMKDKSKSQLKQDLIVLLETKFKKNGFFVEFGATNGLIFSNTHLLETEFNWQGILAEPAKVWHSDLKNNRVCNIEFNCVWRDSSSVLEFNEAVEAELSTIAKYKNSGWASKNRQGGGVYHVKTISLIDLLVKFNAPKIIDYLSIDTEGSEYEILSHFDFDSYRFRVITCEHNYSENRKKIYDLLTSKGYNRKYVGLSKWDDWYFMEL